MDVKGTHSNHVTSDPFKQRLKRKSIKIKLLVGIISLAFTITALCGAANAILLYRESQQNINTRLTENVAAYSQAVQNAIQVYKTQVEAIASNPDLTGSHKTIEEKNELMAQLAQKYGYVSLAVSDAKGNTSDGANISSREYFQKSIAGETYLSSTLVSGATGKTILVVSTKLKSSHYEGIVLAGLDSVTFSNMIDHISVGQSGYGLITDEDGKIIAHTNRDVVSKQTNYIESAKTDPTQVGTASLIRSMIAGNTGTETFELKGISFTGSYTPIPNTDNWSIAVVAKKSELMRSYYTSLWMTSGLAVLFILLSIFFAFRIAGPIVNPIIRLVRRIEGVAEGDLHSEQGISNALRIP